MTTSHVPSDFHSADRYPSPETASTRRPHAGSVLRRVGLALAIVLGLFLVGRAIAELLLVDMGNPASYRTDWGGPSLAGVLAVRCVPAILVLVTAALWWRRRRASRPGSSTVGTTQHVSSPRDGGAA